MATKIIIPFTSLLIIFNFKPISLVAIIKLNLEANKNPAEIDCFQVKFILNKSAGNILTKYAAIKSAGRRYMDFGF